MSALLTPSTTTRIIDRDPERVGRWMADRGTGSWIPGSTCIGLERHGALVAGTTYLACNGASIYANIAIDGHITRNWLWFIFYYPFVQLGVNVLLGTVSSRNPKSQRLVEHFGFRLMATIPNGDPEGDTWLYAMQKHECKWIRSRPHGF